MVEGRLIALHPAVAERLQEPLERGKVVGGNVLPKRSTIRICHTVGITVKQSQRHDQAGGIGVAVRVRDWPGMIAIRARS